jgi:hypothetical protein
MSELTRFETLGPNEDRLLDEIIDSMHRQQEKDNAPGATYRAVHAKHNALLRIKFEVEGNLPPGLAIGLFSEPYTYDGWLRFSNGDPTRRADATKDFRGAAIKLHDVPGERIPESNEPTTQDFILLNTPGMATGTVELFHDAIVMGTASFAVKHPHVAAGLIRQFDSPSSPADIKYWSNTPSLLGPDQVVKYVLVPTSAYVSPSPEKREDDYLSEHLEQHLSQGDATFDFMVQVRTDADTMPVEDISVHWSEDAAPLVKVASLTISPQDFRTAARNDLSEELSFSIAHSLAEHRPLGAIARARMRVYGEMASWRQARDHRARSL